MTRRLALVALLLIAPLSAQAVPGVSIVGVSSSGGDASFLNHNDVLTLDLVVSNDVGVAGIGVDVSGYDSDGDGKANNGMDLLGGTSTDIVFADNCIVGFGCVGGLENIRAPIGTYPTSTGIVEGGRPANPFQGEDAIELHARVVEAIGTTNATGTGQNDIGVGGALISDNDVHVTVQFIAKTGPLSGPTMMTLFADSSIAFGNDVIDEDGLSIGFSGDSYSFTLAPEPGTAMLFGLGLAGLATVRRR
jgi:hypothetical protein